MALVPRVVAAQTREARAEILASYRATLERYRTGDVDGAVSEIASKERAWVDRAMGELLRSTATTTGELEAAVLLHTEAVVDGWVSAADTTFVLQRAGTLLDRAHDRVPAAFRRAWTLLVARHLQFQMQLDVLGARLPVMAREFPNDADVLVAIGSFHEAAGWGDDPPPDLPPSFANRDRSWFQEQAAAAYRKALAANPGMLEARLRLGRVLGESRREDEGIRVLKPLLQDSVQDESVRYLAALFTGAAEFSVGRPEAAADAYRLATTLEPACQTPWLALSSVLRAQGQRAAATALLSRIAAAGAQIDDPWWTYKFGERQKINALVESMRDGVVR
jgi:tetratricopeptide (TPR) repeat protein